MPSDPTSNQPPPPVGKPRRRPAPGVGGNWIWLVIILLLVVMFAAQSIRSPGRITYSEFYNLLTTDQLKEVVQVGDRYEGEVKDKDKLPHDLKTKMPTGKFSVERLQGNDQGVQDLLN